MHVNIWAFHTAAVSIAVADVIDDGDGEPKSPNQFETHLIIFIWNNKIYLHFIQKIYWNVNEFFFLFNLTFSERFPFENEPINPRTSHHRTTTKRPIDRAIHRHLTNQQINNNTKIRFKDGNEDNL